MQCWFIVKGGFCLFFIGFDWVSYVIYYYIFRQDNGQLVCWYWVYLVIFSGYYWDWSILVMLMRYVLVMQMEVNGFFIFVFCF